MDRKCWEHLAGQAACVEREIEFMFQVEDPSLWKYSAGQVSFEFS